VDVYIATGSRDSTLLLRPAIQQQKDLPLLLIYINKYSGGEGVNVMQRDVGQPKCEADADKYRALLRKSPNKKSDQPMLAGIGLNGCVWSTV
jgi:hypothetical protein